MKYFIKLFRKPILWFVMICYGIYLPATELPNKPLLNIPFFDKIVHFTLFFIFCLLLFRPFKKLEMKHLIWAPSISIFFAATFEITQQLLSNTRNSNIYDFIANVTGIAVSFFLYVFFISNKKWEKLL